MSRARRHQAGPSLAACVALSFVLACGAQSNGTDNGGRTHWLRSCAADSECGGGICRENRCTVQCSTQVDCDFVNDAVCGAEHCEPVTPSSPPEQDASLTTPIEATQTTETTTSTETSTESDFDATAPAHSTNTTNDTSTPTSLDAGSTASDASSGPSGMDPPALLDASSDAGVESQGTPDASPGNLDAGIWITGNLDDGAAQELVFGEEVTAYTRDPNNRTLISLVAARPEWGSITLNLVSNPGPVSTGPYTCASGESLIDATMLTETGILSLRSDMPPLGGCEINVVEPGEQEGANVSGTFNAVLVSSSGSVFTITNGSFRGVLNE